MDGPNVGVMECCRVCIQPSQGMMPIFSSFSLASKLMWVCQLKISEGDGLPNNICYSCNQRLNDAFQFKELCLTSDVQLRKYGVVEGAANFPARNAADQNGHDARPADGEGGHPIEVKVEIQQDGLESDDIGTEVPPTSDDSPAKENATRSTTKTFSCEICAVSFKKKTAFISHMRLHMTDEIDEVVDGDESASAGGGYSPVDQNPFLCSICGGSYKFKESFIAHVKLHDGKGDVGAIVGAGDRSYSCAICHASFKMRQGFIAHVRQYHGRENGKLGAKTPAKFVQGGEIASHIAETEGKVYTCAICDAVYRDRAGFVAHIRLHTAERRFECADCRRRFSSLSDLTRHRRRHTGERPYACDVCAKAFARQDHLAKHARTHTGARPYTCGECDRSFAERKTLASHLRSHRGERPYQCDTCGKAFARRNNFAAHVRSHAGEKPYECGRCDRAFLERRGLARHMGVHHAGEEVGGS